jgi:hypothetical protein
VLLDDVVGNGVPPAGVRYGVTPLTASAAPDPSSALTEDIETLYTAVRDAAFRLPLLVTSRVRAITAEQTLRHGLGSLTFLGSYALRGTKDVIAIAPDTLAFALGTVPEISISRESSLNMQNPAGDPMAGGRTSSMWQADCVAIRFRLPVTWALRVNGVSWLTALNW